MAKVMKRKQFHLSSDEENILKQLSRKKGVTEAEVVREAIRELGRSQLKKKNSLIEMAKSALDEQTDAPTDLSIHHDQYLLEIYEHER